jgi:hypothetical protein
MKTKKTIFKIFKILLAVLTFFSCDNPVALGTMLDIQGPVVEIMSPAPRKSVPVQFDLEGTVKDYSGVSRMIMKASANNVDFPRQWRYQKGVWEISEDFGITWLPFAGAQLIGTEKAGEWKIFVDMDVNGQKVDGEYTFSVQAWDKGEISDDNSFKTIVLILDLDPPKVDISRPFLYRGNAAYESAPLKDLHDMLDDDLTWQTPAYLGRFITQEFTLNWQIEDSHNVWSIDLRFYPYDTGIDNDPDTLLPDNYIYRYYQNLPPPPNEINQADYVKPNGSVKVPDLDSLAGFYNGGEIKNRITEKTTVKVVAACFDAAGNANQEKTLGYFIYWPKANSPWIAFTEGLEPPDEYYHKTIASIESDVVMVYPGRSIKATAFQSYGVKEVQYSLYKCDTTSNMLNFMITDPPERENTIIPNIPYSEGMYSNIFPWEFHVPPRTGYYVVKAQAFSTQDIGSEVYYILFRVQDITFPDFPTPPNPAASEPLFKAINANQIVIDGIVSDATEIESLCMVWINPESAHFAAMSQLSYFRDKDYVGWVRALLCSPGGTDIEVAHDPAHPNKVWRLALTNAGVDIETNRILFRYSQTIDLDDLNIGMGKQPLKSQIFLFRAQNPDGKCTIITYAPQGDTLAPVISITDVVIKAGGNEQSCIPGEYVVIQPFADGDTITINGTWKEDSLEHLLAATYFTPNFNITINNQRVSALSPPVLTNTTSTSGTWTITATVSNLVGAVLPLDRLKDTLVVSADVKDIGGNFAEAGCSWLIQSDNLRLMRISSEAEDATYRAGQTIAVFLEFSKPVKLLYTSSAPVLLLNSTGTGTTARAVYRSGQTNQNSRQYFDYAVTANQTTMNLAENFLNVTGLENAGDITAANYPFAWFKGEGTDREEVRITMTAGQNGETKPTGIDYYTRTLPTTTVSTDPDYQYTLVGGKHIAVDTQAPTVSGITSSTPAGYYNTGDIYMTVNFNKPITYTGTPRLTLQITNGTTTSFQTETTDIRASGSSITFKYSIKPGDTTGGNSVVITGNSGGNITDLAGNTLAANGISSLAAADRTLTDVRIETLSPAAPTVRVLTANTNIAGNIVNTNVGGTPLTGESAAAVKNLENLYNQNLWYVIVGNTTGGAYKLARLEYSINNGANWVSFANTTDTPVALDQKISYQIKARQIDMAGNVSAETQAVNFTWDPGTFITRITSTSANGAYTNNAIRGAEVVPITVYFRKPVKFSVQPTLTLNTTPAGTATATGYTLNSLVNEITFNYTVGTNHNTPAGQNLNVTSFNITGTNTAQDEDNVSINAWLGTPPAGSLLSDLKSITVQTGALTTNGNPAFNNAQLSGATAGIAADGSYNTALVIPFSRNIVKGNGTITIIQAVGNYRLPSVLTETQFNRYRSIANVNSYYSRGTNGYNYVNNTNRGPDTSAKYILRYNVDTAAVGNPSATGSTEQKLAEEFRQAEKIVLSVDSQSVRINGMDLIVDLSGSIALQVPGANYLVSYTAGTVQDTLDTPCTAVTNQTVSLTTGVAKPFVRIDKKQEIITTQAGSATAPYLTAVQPFQAGVRMDCRTPGSTIYYFTTNAVTVTNAMNWVFGNNNPADLNTPAVPNQPNDPQTTTAGRNQYAAPFNIGTDNDYQGLQWYVRVKSQNGTGTEWSANSEEMAFRTVVTYVINAMTAGATEAIPGNGDQIWIRGGDAILSSSVPGFPLTWDIEEFDKVKTEGKRAGIRLFTLTAVGTSFANSSTWKWITWDINTDAYFDIILGRDTTSTSQEAQQYGPRQFAYQRAGWTSFKEQYRILPGKHRWLVSDNPTTAQAGKGALNFSGTFSARPTYTGADITYTP